MEVRFPLGFLSHIVVVIILWFCDGSGWRSAASLSVAWEGGGVRAPLPQLEGMPPWLEGMCPEPAGPGVPQFENPHLEITEDITLWLKRSDFELVERKLPSKYLFSGLQFSVVLYVGVTLLKSVGISWAHSGNDFGIGKILIVLVRGTITVLCQFIKQITLILVSFWYFESFSNYSEIMMMAVFRAVAFFGCFVMGPSCMVVVTPNGELFATTCPIWNWLQGSKFILGKTKCVGTPLFTLTSAILC